MRVDGSGCGWMGENGSGWKCVEVGGSGWEYGLA